MLKKNTNKTQTKYRIKKSKATIVSSSPNNAAAGDLDRVTRKLTEQQIAMGSFGVLAAVFFTLISAKVIMAQFFIYMLQIWIDLINALLVLASNFLYIRRKARAEGKFASKAGGGGGGESVIQICHQPCVMEEERIIGGGQTPSSAEVRPSTGEIIRLPTNNDQQQQQQQAWTYLLWPFRILHGGLYNFQVSGFETERNLEPEIKMSSQHIRCQTLPWYYESHLKSRHLRVIWIYVFDFSLY